MGIDQYWLSEVRLQQLSRQMPSTSWGISLMRDAWPRVYTHLLSSDTYRGCTAALSLLCAEVRSETPLFRVVQVIEAADQSLKQSSMFPPGSDASGGAGLVLTNAWQRSQSGLNSAQLAAAFESELIYASQLFMQAQQYEAQGAVLP